MLARSTRTRVADRIAASIAQTGLRMAFGHPGGEVAVLIDALEAAGIRFLLTHHENEAAFMAGGYGELTGRPGLCLATLGPGATNMVTGVASALLDRAPLLAITGALAQGALPGTTHQALDLNALYRPVTKRSVAISQSNAQAAIDSAIIESQAERPGPVHLGLPADVAASEASDASGDEPSQLGGPLVGDAVQTRSNSALAEARRRLATARRPAIVAGMSAVRGGAQHALRDLAKDLGAPIAVPPKAKGLVSEDDPCFAGVLEMAGDDLIVEFLNHADLLLAVGLDVVELDKPWRFRAPVIHIDGVANSEGYYPAILELTGPIVPTLASLTPVDSRKQGWPQNLMRHHAAELRSYVCPESERLQAWQVVQAARAKLPPETIATCDVGAHKMLVGQVWQTFSPRTFFMANGLSSMGYAIPVAAAACLTYPDRPVVAFVGDGGLSMYLGELETLVRLGVSLLIVVFADNRLELIRRAQLNRGARVVGTSFANPDFQYLAKAFGIKAHIIEKTREIDGALSAALTERGVRLVVVCIDGADYHL